MNYLWPASKPIHNHQRIIQRWPSKPSAACSGLTHPHLTNQQNSSCQPLIFEPCVSGNFHSPYWSFYFSSNTPPWQGGILVGDDRKSWRIVLDVPSCWFAIWRIVFSNTLLIFLITKPTSWRPSSFKSSTSQRILSRTSGWLSIAGKMFLAIQLWQFPFYIG